jgi:hypothetical protein
MPTYQAGIKWLFATLACCLLLSCNTVTTPTPPANPMTTTSSSETLQPEQAGQQAPLDPTLFPSAKPGFSSGQQNASAECVAMAKEIQALRGKPLRRTSLEERYQTECKR